ncbi:MAG TPA: response regulator, partial [Nannocystaceae bacterium]|nr:response regulator [Nannocystaceae bacterium]
MDARERVQEQGQAHRVMLVDDDEALVRVLADGLARRGFDVVRCSSAGDALAAVHDAGLEAIVTDLRMPGTGGVEL